MGARWAITPCHIDILRGVVDFIFLGSVKQAAE
jgi:hypothetical protein